MMAFVLPFESPDATLEAAGGKGASLSRLARAGFPVPPGFIITTRAYHAFVEAHRLQPRILAFARDKRYAAEAASTAIRGLFDEPVIPPEILSAIQSAYASLMGRRGGPGQLALAVRSSATAEDLPGASFAGQQDSYLNVCGEEALLAAVKRCWASLWTARALDYRARHAVDSSGVSLAVVVQAMVPADAAGILFTANPLSGARDEIVVDASWGLGEAIVGGRVTPDHVVADKMTGAIKQLIIGDKSAMTVPAGSGTAEQAVAVSQRHAQVLGALEVAELARLGTAIEVHAGAPQDIEWCRAVGRFYIVQARPITTLPPEPVRWDSPIPGAKWHKDVQAGEWLHEPPSPLGATTTLATMVNARQRAGTWPPPPKVRAPWFTRINGWFYLRVDHRPLSLVAFLLGTLVSLLLGRLDGHRRAQRGWPARLAALAELEHVDVQGLSGAGLLARADRLLAELAEWWLELTWGAAVGRICAQGLGALRIPGLVDPNALFAGNDSLLLEAERALRRAARDPGRVADYLARFGHTLDSADPVDPTLRESAERLAFQLAAARMSDLGPDERLARARHRRKQAVQAVQAAPGLRGVLARRAMQVGQSYAAHTDDAVFHFQRVLAAIRAAYLELGRQLALSGHLRQPEDVFYVEREELTRALTCPEGLAAKVDERRALRQRQRRLVPPPFIPPATDPRWAHDAFFRFMPPAVRAATFERGLRERDGKRVLVGSSGSAGRARGIARVLAGPDDFGRFQKGDILVTRATSPIWTPLLGIAAAVVTEVGGPFAHAAIVAREYGIPLVDGALDATRVIADGTPVVVDGSSGIVEL